MGILGTKFNVEEGHRAARAYALNLISQLRVVLGGNLNRVITTVRLAGYVNATPDFYGQSGVMNGVSDLFVGVFVEPGRHTRMAVGVSALPYNVAVEVEGVFQVSTT